MYCYVQSRGHFSTRNNPSIPACREIIAGLGAYLVPGKKILPERTVCIQSGKLFFTPEEPIHPGLSRNFTVILIIQKVSLRPGSVQSLQIAGMKQNVLFLQRASMRKLIKGKHEKRCSFLERKGDRRSRWIVDSTLFE